MKKSSKSKKQEKGIKGFCLHSRKGYMLVMALGGILLILGLVFGLTGLGSSKDEGAARVQPGTEAPSGNLRSSSTDPGALHTPDPLFEEAAP